MIIQVQPSRKAAPAVWVNDLVRYISGGDRQHAQEVSQLYYDHHVNQDVNIGQFIDDYEEGKERVAYWCADGFDGDTNISNAIKDIALTQSLYKGTGNDQNLYHIVAAFPPGELPTTAILADVEKTVVDGLGFTDHQRVSAVHVDKTHLHMHIVINKINDDLKKHTPYNDYKKARTLAMHLEAKHKLVRTDHRTKLERKGSSAFTRADDIQRLSGLPSLADWVKAEPIKDIYTVLDDPSIKSWDALHHVFAVNGLAIRKRGAGLVIQDIGLGIFCKASGVSRQLSHRALTEKFGEYAAPSFYIADVVPTRTYSNKKFDGFEKGMYSEYLEDRKALNKIKYNAKYKARGAFRKDVQQTWDAYNGAMATLRGQKHASRKYFAYKLALQLEHYSRLADCQARFHDAMFVIKKDMSNRSFIDFVGEKAMQGDTNALNKINDLYGSYYEQHHKTPQNNFNVGISGVSTFDTNYATLTPNSFYSKHGGLYTRLNDGSLMFTQSKQIWINAKSEKALTTALLIARSKYGRTIELTGDRAHILRTVALAERNKMGIVFQGVSKQQAQSIERGEHEQ